MSLAEELLNTMTTDMSNSANIETEQHIIIGADRFITVPENLKRIAVQHDHMIETVTFDCPRYWDKHDMSQMKIYVNYIREDMEPGSDLCTNVTIDEEDENIMHFDWTITGHLSAIHGPVSFLVCIQKVASDGTTTNHWNSELNRDLFVSEGLEVESSIAAVYPGIITALLTRMDVVEQMTTNEAMRGYVADYIQNSDTNISEIVSENMSNNGGNYVSDYMESDPNATLTIQEGVNKYLSDNLDFIEEAEVVYASYVNKNTTFANINNLEIGDTFTGSDHVTSSDGYYAYVKNISAGHYVDFKETNYIPTGGESQGGLINTKMIVTDTNAVIIDLVPYADLAVSKYYICKEDCKIYITSTYEYTMPDDAVLFKIKKYYDFSELGGGDGTAVKYTEQSLTEEQKAQARDNIGVNEKDNNPLWGKRVTFNGDSICYGSGYEGGYAKIIAERNKMTYENLGGGGATVTAEMYTSSGEARRWLCRTIEDMAADADYAILEGGVNDAWNSAPIGKLSSGYNAELDDTTYYGAFESMLKQLVLKYQGKKYGYIITPKMTSLFSNTGEADNYYYIALECCAKWGVSVCDLNVITPDLSVGGLTDVYTIDGTHPNEAGYKAYYCDQIESWMKTLTAGGNSLALLTKKLVVSHNKDTSAHADIRNAIKALQDGKLSNTGVSFRRAKLALADGTTIEIDVLTAADGSVIVPYTNRVPLSIDTDGSVYNDVGYMTGYRLNSSGVISEQINSFVTGFIPTKNGDIVRVYGCEWGTTKHAMNYICAYDANFNFIGGYSTTGGKEVLTLSKKTLDICSHYEANENLDTTFTLSCTSEIAYIRVSSKGDTSENDFRFNGENMIITINEEII